MKRIYILKILFFLAVDLFAQEEELFKMKQKETNNFLIERSFTSDSVVSLTENTNSISGLAISGKIILTTDTSLVRVILVTEGHEYLVYEAYPLICDKREFSFEKACDETDLLNNEKPVELEIIVRNAKFELNSIQNSTERLNQTGKISIDEFKRIDKISKEKFKAQKINKNKKIKTWLAGTTEVSLLPFESKKNLFGGNNDIQTKGMEYYVEGIYSFEDFTPFKNNNLKSASTIDFVSEFDWRNRHGQKWDTPIRNQNSCGSCWAFAATAVIEVMTNLYFNRHLNIDLSEQDLISCQSSNGCAGGNPYLAYNYIKIYGIVNESCFPYFNASPSGYCSNKCIVPSEKIIIANYQTYIGISSIKNALINYGPIAGSIHDHFMELVGYKDLKAGDNIRYYATNPTSYVDVIINPGNPLIGMTVWIYKNSWGTVGQNNGGYVYALFDYNYSIAGQVIIPPLTSLQYPESYRNCSDNDHDGYYWWGIGSKPSSCPVCAPNTPDGDDSNPNKGPMDTFGNCTVISSPYTFPAHQITTSEIWSNTLIECGNVIVKNGGNLTLNGANVNLEGSATFSVEIGGILTFNSGLIQ